MKSQTLLIASALSLAGLSACAPANPPVMRAALACPEKQGVLTRVSFAPDKKSCIYTTRDGAEVSLQLLSFTGDASAALQPIQRELEAGWAASQSASPSPNARSAVEAEKAAHEAEADATGTSDDPVDVAKGYSGETTRVDLPGIHVDANDSGAKVDIGPIHVDADDAGAEIHVSRDVRMRGEALSRKKRGYRATYILANDYLQAGYKVVGYEAGGPRTGPIAVAVVKSRADDHDGLFKAVQRLVRDNGGV